MRIIWNTRSAAAARALRRPGRPRAAQTRASRRSRRPPSRCAPACLPRPLGSAPVWKSRASGFCEHLRSALPPSLPASPSRAASRPWAGAKLSAFCTVAVPPPPAAAERAPFRASRPSGPAQDCAGLRGGGSGAGPGAVPAARGPPAAQRAGGRVFAGRGGRSSRRRAPARPRCRGVTKEETRAERRRSRRWCRGEGGEVRD